VFRACAWCGLFMGVYFPVESDDTTHGMCRRCVERFRREDIGSRPEVVIVVRRTQQLERLAVDVADLPRTTLMLDRRTALQRRQRAIPVKQERRQRARRRPHYSQRDPWLALGVEVVPVASVLTR
jgi:hypothetical protein